jgi:CRP-like cAMP-binding protein
MCTIDWFTEVKVLGAGASFGELALINENNRAATIHCITDSYFAVIGAEEYKKVLKKIEQKLV